MPSGDGGPDAEAEAEGGAAEEGALDEAEARRWPDEGARAVQRACGR
jgi:hypothetical protein